VIVNALDEREANEILVYLNSKGLDASKVQSPTTGGGGGQKIILWDISVKAEDATNAMQLLNQAGLPRRRGQNLLNLFSNVGLVPSEMQDKIRFQAGLADQIANTIRHIDGVLDADVVISYPKEDPLIPAAERGKITASVYVKHNGVLDDPNAHLITKIRRLVSAAVTGLDFDNVTVIADRARFGEAPGEGMPGGAEAQEKKLVSIWSVLVADESLTRFRLIFFGFTIIILLLVLALIWFGWKVYPLLHEHGGLQKIFSLTPLVEGPPKEEEKVKEGEEKKAEGEKETQGQIDKEIDET
jgi:type III secretion protein J